MTAQDDFDELESEELGEYVPAVFARTPAEAQKYLQLLEDYGVPARVDEKFLPLKGRRNLGPESVAVLVPEALLEDAKGFLDDLSDEELNAADDEDDDLEEDEEEEDEDEEEEDDEEEEEEEDEDELGLFSDEDELEEDKEEDEDGLDEPGADQDKGKGPGISP